MSNLLDAVRKEYEFSLDEQNRLKETIRKNNVDISQLKINASEADALVSGQCVLSFLGGVILTGIIWGVCYTFFK